MSIHLECFCGALIEVGDDLAGGTTECQECSDALPVPSKEWSKGFLKHIKTTSSENDNQRREAFLAIGHLGGACALPTLSRGLEDRSRAISNACLHALLNVGPVGYEHLLKEIKQGNTSIGRLIAMVREEELDGDVDQICEMIDAGLFKEHHISELIPLLGDIQRRRCVATLKALRRAYPSLHVLVDNALSGYETEEEEQSTVPDSAKGISDKSVDRVHHMAESQRTAKRRGCLGMLLFMLAPALAVSGAIIWRIIQDNIL